MLSIKPVTGYVAKQDAASTVVAPAYDNFTPKQRRQFAEENPNNYINTIRYIDEFSEAEEVTIKQLLKQNKQSVQRLLSNDLYQYVSNAMFIYQLETKTGHIQTGIMANLPFSDYENDYIRIHEYTRKDREKGLSKYIQKVGIVSSPVCIAYAKHSSIEDVVANITTKTPDLVLETDITQRLWIINDSKIIEELSYYFKQVNVSYLADGHHRIASGHRYAKYSRKKNPNHTGEESYNSMLAVLFPDEEMQILAYNRCVRDLNNLSEGDFVSLLKNNFDVQIGVDKFHAQPMHRHEFGMLIGDNWYKLTAHAENIPNDPVSVLGVSILQKQILSDILNINDPQKDPRLEYIAGDLGLEGIEHASKNGFQAVFSCFPTSIQEMMDVADAGQIMPPKSTWFSPKARSGLIISYRK